MTFVNNYLMSVSDGHGYVSVVEITILPLISVHDVSSNMTDHQIFNISNTTNATCKTSTDYPSNGIFKLFLQCTIQIIKL